MDLLTSIFDEIKSRFGNRFVINVIIYWLLFNWKITVALFWYDTTQIEAEGCRSTFEFISDQLENNSHWCLVFIYSLISTVLLPIIKTFIFVFDERVKVDRTNRISRVKKNELSQQNISLNLLIRKINDKSFLNGKWKVIIHNRKSLDSDKSLDSVSYYKIKDGSITVLHERGNEVDKFLITDFWFIDKPNERKLHMKIYLMNNYYTNDGKMDILHKEFISFLSLEYDDKKRIIMRGYQNNDYVEYFQLD